MKNGKMKFNSADLKERYADTRPEVHGGDEEATDQVLKDMAVTDALDDFDADD